MLRAILNAAFRPSPLPETPLYAAAQVLVDALPNERTPLDLQKLLYICQTVHIGRHGIPLFEETFRASVMGPFSTAVRDAFRSLKRQRFQRTKLLTPSMIAVIEEVARDVGPYSSAHLVSLTQGSNSLAWARNFPLPFENRTLYAGGRIPHEDMADQYRAWMDAVPAAAA